MEKKFVPNFYCQEDDHYLFAFEKNMYDTYDEAKARLINMLDAIDDYNIDDVIPRIIECRSDGFFIISLAEHDYTLEEIKNWK